MSLRGLVSFSNYSNCFSSIAIAHIKICRRDPPGSSDWLCKWEHRDMEMDWFGNFWKVSSGLGIESGKSAYRGQSLVD
jgi:hypothetical protein